MDISNKTLAWMVIAAIVVSFAGTLVSLSKLNNTDGFTGLASVNTTGNAQVQLSTQTGLTFSVGTLAFGSGSVNGTAPNQCNLTINKSTGTSIVKAGGCTGFADTNAGGPLTLENTGNTVLNVTLNFSKNAFEFIGGHADSGIPDPSFLFLVIENETNACGIINSTLANWVEVVNTTVGQFKICDNMNFQDTQDSLSIGVRVAIPSNALGNRDVYITATGTS
jgi:hypothetical protein